jgi:hypothetical protein
MLDRSQLRSIFAAESSVFAVKKKTPVVLEEEKVVSQNNGAAKRSESPYLHHEPSHESVARV